MIEYVPCVCACVCVCSALNGEDIEPHHCSIAVEDQQNSKVRLMLDEGECFVNHTLTTEDSDLSHGELRVITNQHCSLCGLQLRLSLPLLSLFLSLNECYRLY